MIVSSACGWYSMAPTVVATVEQGEGSAVRSEAIVAVIVSSLAQAVPLGYAPLVAHAVGLGDELGHRTWVGAAKDCDGGGGARR